MPDAVEARDAKWKGRTMKTSEILRILHQQGISTYGIVEKSELIDLLERSSALKERSDDVQDSALPLTGDDVQLQAGDAREAACVAREQGEEEDQGKFTGRLLSRVMKGS